MQNTDGAKNLMGSFCFSNISEDDVAIIRQAENQLNQNKQEKVILIAYDAQNH